MPGLSDCLNGRPNSMYQFTSLLGVLVCIGIAVLLSENRRRISGRLIGASLLLQGLIAGLFLAFPPVVSLVELTARGVIRVLSFAQRGSQFVFGPSLTDTDSPWGFIFAVQVLPGIVFVAALMSVLYHAGVMQRLIGLLAWLLRRSLGVTGSEALAVAANIFVGQTEAPLCVKPYIAGMTRSQLITLMTGGFATVSGSGLAAYIGLLSGNAPDAALVFTHHLLTASVLSAPAAFLMAKTLVPETEPAMDEAQAARLPARETHNMIDALASGAADGLWLALNIGVMLLAFVAFLALLNWPLEVLSTWPPVAAWRDQLGLPPLTLQTLFGIFLTPLAAAMSIPWEECRAFGGLLGEKVLATELVAYQSLASLLQADTGVISPRTAHIASYALCGFANFASIGVQIGALRVLVPDRRGEVSRLAVPAMIGGALASWLTACIAALFLPFD